MLGSKSYCHSMKILLFIEICIYYLEPMLKFQCAENELVLRALFLTLPQ